MFRESLRDFLNKEVKGNIDKWESENKHHDFINYDALKSFKEFVDLFPYSEGSRQIFDLSIELVQTSCGWAVPEYEFKKERDILDKSNKVAGEKGIRSYWESSNTKSLDGLKTNIIEKNIGK